MSLTKVKLGSFIEKYNEKCNVPNLTKDEVSGINRDKEFFEPTVQIGADTTNYKIVPPGYFACNLMHVGRDKVLPIALNHTDKNKIVSPAYDVFQIADETLLLKEYFFMLIKSKETDRYFWFNTDSSIRDGMAWTDFCNMEFELPKVSIQKKYVKIYNALDYNQNSYRQGLNDLVKVSEMELDKVKKETPRVSVGNLLEEVDVRNKNGVIKDVRGINITKNFMPSKASVNRNTIKNYKIVEKNQFAYSSMQTGRDKSIRIALLKEDNPIVVSPAYKVLRVKTNEVLPEYIMMWFTRGETDRFGWFASDSSIRANLDLNRFYEFQIPVPNKQFQRSIVNIYNLSLERRNIVSKIDNLINSISPVLIKGSLEEVTK